jgi:hypothetical protein
MGWNGCGSRPRIETERGQCPYLGLWHTSNGRSSEKKWAKARRWAGARVTGKNYKLPIRRRPDGTIAGSSKRLTSRFYQLKAGHCLAGQYLNWTKSRPSA